MTRVDFVGLSSFFHSSQVTCPESSYRSWSGSHFLVSELASTSVSSHQRVVFKNDVSWKWTIRRGCAVDHLSTCTPFGCRRPGWSSCRCYYALPWQSYTSQACIHCRLRVQSTSCKEQDSSTKLLWSTHIATVSSAFPGILGSEECRVDDVECNQNSRTISSEACQSLDHTST